VVVSRGATGIDYSAGLVRQLLCNDSVAISCLIFKDSFKYFIVRNSVFVVYLVICLGLLIYIIFFHRVKEFVLLAYEFNGHYIGLVRNGWLYSRECCANLEFWGLYLYAWKCSLNLVSKILPVWPVYVFLQFLQVNW
jgi:hypothetical protein